VSADKLSAQCTGCVALAMLAADAQAAFVSSKGGAITGDLAISGKLTAKLVAPAGMQLNASADAPVVCDANSKGYIYLDTTKNHFYGCNGVAFVKMDSNLGPDIINQSFTFTSDSNTGGDPKFVADKVNITVPGNWPNNCIQSNSATTHWLKVDFGQKHVISAFGVFGYPGGSHKPSGTWSFQGSNDDANWVTVWSGDTSLWPVGVAGSYPPPFTNQVTSPGAYRYYRVIADGWTNGYMLMCNLAMYE